MRANPEPLPGGWPELEAARADWRYQPAPDCLRGQVLLVTGAGDGIGRVAARTFAAFGADVLLLGRTRQKLEALADQILECTDTQPIIVPCDLERLDDTSAEALLESIAGEYGRLDGILHNASLLGPKAPLAHYPTSAWQQLMRVNAFAPFLLTRTLLPALLQSERASVVFTSSSVGRRGRAYWGAYAISKFALEGTMQVLADELEHTGRVRVNSLNPGATRTAMRAAAYPGENPMDVATPEARMDICIYLFDRLSAHVNGQALDARDWTGPDAD